MDNSDATGITTTGARTASSATAGYRSSNYINDGNTGKGTKTIRYTPTISTSASTAFSPAGPAAPTEPAASPSPSSRHPGRSKSPSANARDRLTLGQFHVRRRSLLTICSVVCLARAMTSFLLNGHPKTNTSGGPV